MKMLPALLVLSKKRRAINCSQIFLLVITGLLFFAQPAFPQSNGIQVADGATAQISGGKSPVVKVTDAEGKELASIPVEENPRTFLYAESVNTLYVVHNEKKFEHFISAVNLTTQKVDKQIKVGAGAEEELMVSNGGRRLFCYTAGKLSGEPGNREKWLEPPTEPAVSVIDTASNEVIATYTWFDSFRAGVPEKRWFFTSQFLAGTDDGTLIVTSKAFWGKTLSEKLVIFSGQSSHPAFMINAGGPVVASMFSKDEKFLFVAVEGEKKTDGSLLVVDLQKGTTVTHALSDHPTRLFRLGSAQEPWVLGSKEMRSFSEAGELGDRRIPLNKPRKGEEGDESGASAFLDGFPGETISLSEDRAAMQINNKHGGSRHKVALIDLKKLQIDAILPTMSAGEIAGIRTGRFVAAFAMSMGTGGAVVFMQKFIRNEALAARPDGRFLFVLDLEGHQVTAIDVQAATVVKRIAVNHSITKLQVSSDGKHLICFGRQTQQIDLESNNLEN